MPYSILRRIHNFYGENKEKLISGEKITFYARKGDLDPLTNNFKERIENLLHMKRVPFGLKDIDIGSQVEIREKEGETIKERKITTRETLTLRKYPISEESEQDNEITVECTVEVPDGYQTKENYLEPDQLGAIMSRIFSTLHANYDDNNSFQYAAPLRFTDCIPVNDYRNGLEYGEKLRMEIGKPLNEKEKKQEETEFQRVNNAWKVAKGTKITFRNPNDPANIVFPVQSEVTLETLIRKVSEYFEMKPINSERGLIFQRINER